MTQRAKKPRPFTLKDAFETAYARREMERRQRDEAQRKQQEADLAGAERLFDALRADPAFLGEHGLSADRRRYTVSLDHQNYRISAYFEGGQANITLSDKRMAGQSVPRKQETAETPEAALTVVAQFLVDETR